MKARHLLLALAAVATQAFAGTPTIIAPALDGPAPCKKTPKLCSKRLSGSLTAGYATNYTCRGLVASHALAEGDGAEKLQLDLSYDIGRKGFFTLENRTAYTVLSSGHHLLGVQETNIDNELTVETSLKYTRKLWFASLGHQFTHGGLLGVYAKNIEGNSAAVTNEAFLTLGMTPLSWLELGVKISYAFDGMEGFWFEPYVKGAWTLVGCKKAPKLQAAVTLAMSATAGYFPHEVGNACGAQAWWIEAALPWHITKHFVLTPAVSLNWLGCGAQNTGNLYRNHGVVGSVSASYVF